MTLVKVEQLFFSNKGFVVLLKGCDDDRSLPIFIGDAEAHAIAIHINRIRMPRPLTHDLLKNTLDFLECRLMGVEVSSLREGTFYARLMIERDGESMDMDARPSDAIALALRCGAPIYVDDQVMDEAGRVLTESTPHELVPQDDSVAEGSDISPELTALETMKKGLDVAVLEERYEDAAKLRDEIRRVQEATTGG